MPDDPLFAEFGAALRRLGDPDAGGTPGLLRRISGAGSADVASFVEIWPTIAAERRAWLARRMLEAAEADFHLDFRPLFYVLIDDGDPAVRATAIDGLWEATDLRLIDRFVDRLRHDTDPRVRASAATALGVFVERGEFEERCGASVAPAIGVLVAMGSDEGEPVEVRRRAIESVGFADREDVRALIAAAADSGAQSLVAGALRAMGHSADSSWGERVMSRLGDADGEVRFEAAHAAGELELEEAVPRLAEMIETDGDRAVQVEAIWALGEIGGPRAQRSLERLAARVDAVEDEDLASAVEDALAAVALSEGYLSFGEAGPGGPPVPRPDEADDEWDDEDEVDADEEWDDEDDLDEDDWDEGDEDDDAWAEEDEDEDDELDLDDGAPARASSNGHHARRPTA